MENDTLITQDARAFAEALPDGGVLMALDLGTQTIGTAFCDSGWRFASAAQTLPRGKFGRDSAKLAELAKARSVAGLIIGLPRNLDGTQGARAQSSRAYAANCAKALGLPILLWDERWSTQAAERDLIAQDTSRARRAEKIDAHAAAVILQGAIDAMTGHAF